MDEGRDEREKKLKKKRRRRRFQLNWLEVREKGGRENPLEIHDDLQTVG